jgi:hypothetical protein
MDGADIPEELATVIGAIEEGTAFPSFQEREAVCKKSA